jgi:hypothetical protein
MVGLDVGQVPVVLEHGAAHGYRFRGRRLAPRRAGGQASGKINGLYALQHSGTAPKLGLRSPILLCAADPGGLAGFSAVKRRRHISAVFLGL